jgi:hypothetical protein
VDESALETVKALLRMPIAPEERESARSALRLADKANDLAFAGAVWRMAVASRGGHARGAARSTRVFRKRLRTLATDKATVDRLTAACGESQRGRRARRLKDQLELAKAVATLDQDEVRRRRSRISSAPAAIRSRDSTR